MIRTALINVEEGVSGLRARADAEEERALNDEPVSEGMAGLGLPVRFIAGVRMGGVEVIEAVGPEAEELVEGFLDVARRGRGLLFGRFAKTSFFAEAIGRCGF